MGGTVTFSYDDEAFITETYPDAMDQFRDLMEDGAPGAWMISSLNNIVIIAINEPVGGDA
jgi:hypothetical protein